MALQELLKAYVRFLQAGRNLSPHTLRNYQSDLRGFFRYLAGGDEAGFDPAAADRHALRRYLAHQREVGTVSGSLARKVSTIRSFYRFLAREGYISDNPFEAVRGPRRQQRLPNVLTVGQVAALLAVPTDDTALGRRDQAILELLYAAGLRISEMVALDVADADLKGAMVRVLGKGDRERICLMGRPAVAALRRYLREARPALARHPGERALFLNRDGGRLSARAVQIMIKRYAALAGIEQRVYPHLLRHTFATHMVDRGAKLEDGGAVLRVVQELLGHKSVSTTQIYTHVTEAQQRRVYLAAFYNQYRPRRGRDEESDEDPSDKRP